MSKILIPPRNTSWGKIINPVSENETRHTISFPEREGMTSIQVRDEFINYELFNNELEYNDLENGKWVNKGIVRLNSREAFVDISENDYKFEGDTIERLLNLDYLIVYENNVYKFYSVESSIPAGNSKVEVFSLKLSLDVFITYPIQTILSDNQQNLINRAHIDRYNLPIEIVKSKEPYDVNLDIVEKVDIQNDYNLISGEDRLGLLNNIKWMKVKQQALSETDKLIYGTRLGTGFSSTYILFWIPVSDKGIIKINGVEVNPYVLISNEAVKEIDLTQFPPRTIMNGIDVEITNSSTQQALDEYNFIWDTDDENNGLVVFDTTLTALKQLFSSDLDGFTGNKVNIPNQHDFTLRASNIDLPRDINYEHKLFSGEYEYYKFITQETESVIYSPEDVIKNGALTMEHINSYTYDSNNYIRLLNTNYFDNDDVNKWLKYKISLNLVKDLNDLYQLNNSQSYKTDQLKVALNKMFGVFGSGKFGIRNFLPFGKKYSEQMDRVNAPDLISGSNGDFLQYIQNESFVSLQKVYSSKQNVVYDYLTQFGYTINKLGVIKDYIDTRYYYNYVECDEIFNTIDKSLSPEIKQEIDTYFRNGITFFHFRGADTWKGIKEYSYENVEMSNL